jgi:hypothetical protein
MFATWRTLWCAGVTGLGAAVLSSSLAADPPGTPPGAASPIAVTCQPVFEVVTSTGTALRVDCHYHSRSERPVRVRGIGLMPASGELSYLTTSRSIDFLDPASGAVILSVPLGKGVRLMGSDVLDTPAEAEFPQASRSGVWSGPAERFADAVRIVLGRRFPLGYFPYETQGEDRYLTTYAELQVAEPRRAQIAVLISHRVESSGAATASPSRVRFAIRVRAREKLSHTRWRDAIAGETASAVGTFATDLLSALETQARTAPTEDRP